jgi:hypothetical protein
MERLRENAEAWDNGTEFVEHTWKLSWTACLEVKFIVSENCTLFDSLVWSENYPDMLVVQNIVKHSSVGFHKHSLLIAVSIRWREQLKKFLFLFVRNILYLFNNYSHKESIFCTIESLRVASERFLRSQNETALRNINNSIEFSSVQLVFAQLPVIEPAQ